MRHCVIPFLMMVVACDEPDAALRAPQVELDAMPASRVQPTPANATRHAALNPRLLRRFRPLRADLADVTRPRGPALVELGKMLYFDKRLSKSGDTACNTCHALDRYGVDGRAASIGDDGKAERRNTPSTYNAAGMISQFWDGRAADVEAQALGPLTNPDEMNSSAQHVVDALHAIPEYRARFGAAFPEDPRITIGHVAAAIGAFERGLVTPARWDRFVTGDVDALTPDEIEGLRVFTSVGCLTCHTGELLGGTSYQMAGVVEPWPSSEDRGRYEITRVASDDMVFRVPSLRNVAKTAPYFHDGSASTLSQAIQMMGRHQLGIELTAKEVASIETWMGSLTGELPTDYIRPLVMAGQRGVK